MKYHRNKVEELEIISRKEKRAFKKHYSQILGAFEKLTTQVKNNQRNNRLNRTALKAESEKHHL